MQRLAIHPNQRQLCTRDGQAFFWLADTAWQLIHCLSREDTQHYLERRVHQGFNVVQAVVLAEYDGLDGPNAYGRRPLLYDAEHGYSQVEPDLTGDDHYWTHVDYVIDEAARQGLYIALLPTWGDKITKQWGQGPEIFTPENAARYGRWIGARYADRDNLIWVMGGDRTPQNRRHLTVIDEMARGIRAAGATQLMTLHPSGESSSSTSVGEEDWLDFNMIQSSHNRPNFPNYEMIAQDWALEPAKPVIEGEPCYEDHPIGFRAENGYFDDWDVRQAAYWAVLAGSPGVTYGHHCVWRMVKEPTDYFILNWRRAVERPGAVHMGLMRRLFESSTRPFSELRPDQTILAANDSGANYQAAARGERYAYVYAPTGLRVQLQPGVLPGETLTYSWFDPRTGHRETAGQMDNRADAEVQALWPPSSGRGNDWILVVEGCDDV